MEFVVSHIWATIESLEIPQNKKFLKLNQNWFLIY